MKSKLFLTSVLALLAVSAIILMNYWFRSQIDRGETTSVVQPISIASPQSNDKPHPPVIDPRYDPLAPMVMPSSENPPPVDLSSPSPEIEEPPRNIMNDNLAG